MVWNATVVNEALRMSLDSGFGRINMHMKDNIISRIHISSGIKSAVLCTEEMIQCSQHTTNHWLIKPGCTSISRAQCWSLIFGDLPVTQHQMWPCEAWGVEVSTALHAKSCCSNMDTVFMGPLQTDNVHGDKADVPQNRSL